MGARKGVPKKNRRFSDDQVREMFRLKAEGMTFAQLAEKFGSVPSGINHIIHRKIYKNVTGVTEVVVKRGGKRGVRNSHRAFTDDQVREIRRLRREGMSGWDIAAKFGGARTTIGQIIRRKVYKDVTEEPDSTPTHTAA